MIKDEVAVIFNLRYIVVKSVVVVRTVVVDSKIVVVVEKSVVGMIVVVKLSSHSHSKSKLYMIEKKYEKNLHSSKKFQSSP